MENKLCMQINQVQNMFHHRLYFMVSVHCWMLTYRYIYNKFLPELNNIDQFPKNTVEQNKYSGTRILW